MFVTYHPSIFDTCFIQFGVARGAYPNCLRGRGRLHPWKAATASQGRHRDKWAKQPPSLTLTPRVNLDSPNSLPYMFFGPLCDIHQRWHMYFWSFYHHGCLASCFTEDDVTKEMTKFQLCIKLCSEGPLCNCMSYTEILLNSLLKWRRFSQEMHPCISSKL